MNDDYSCKGGVVKSKTLCECSNTPQTPKGIHGPFVGKIPVVIAEPVVQVVVESFIDIKEPVLEIKRIKKNLFINQCKLIDMGCSSKGKLFLEGFVRKNIEYATAGCICKGNKSISGDIKHETVNVPFNCVTEIDYFTRPQIRFQENAREMSLFIQCMNGNECCCDDTIVGRYPCEQNFRNFECFNEKVYCELEEVKFFEDDIHKKQKPVGCDFPVECTFEGINEKMVILIRLKLLQNQQVDIAGGFCSKDGK